VREEQPSLRGYLDPPGCLGHLPESAEPSATAPVARRCLFESERRILDAFRELCFGCYERLRIQSGELVLEPWPAAIKTLKFGAQISLPTPPNNEFELKNQVVEFFRYVRKVRTGEIRRLEIRHGLPFAMDVQAGERS